MNKQDSHILLLTESLNTYNLIACCLQKIELLKINYQLTWLSDCSQWDSYYSDRKYQTYIVDYRFFLILKEKNYCNSLPIITLCQSYETGINSVRAGATDYWHLQKLDEYNIERSLRLTSSSYQQSLSLKNKQNKAFYQDFFDDCVDGLFSIDRLSNGTLVYGIVNSVYAKITGMPKEEITGKQITEILPPLEERKYQDCFFSQKNISYENTVKTKNELQTWLIMLVPIRNQQGEIFQIRGSARNITKDKQGITQQIRQTRYRNLLRSIALKIRQSLNISKIITTTVTELQTMFYADRVVILQFLVDGSAKIIEESVTPNFPSMLEQIISDEYYNEILSHQYEEGSFYAWEDIETVAIDADYYKFLQKYQVRANLIIPIVRRSVIRDRHNVYPNSIARIWGLLCVQQCSKPRKWTRDEIELLQQLVEQLNTALSQAELLESEVKQRQELARSNAELEQFAYVASHDLQAPLQTISNYAQLLEHRYREKLDEKADKYINYMVSAVGRMKNQIDDLLEYSRVDRQQNTFRETNFCFIVKQAIANLQSEIELNQAEIIYSDNLPKLIVDHSQFVTLFQNLISNSLKYRCSIPPAIKIDVTQQDDVWQFCIQDNGIGIEKQHQKRIFQIFQRLHTQEEYPGTGIGLAICQKIVQRHGGDIWVESELDRGTTFYFTIPNQNN
ncbi:Multi-sensor signal transduction histidine kinase (fragment) [Hyella patelloides LEGE 07179]|uniref:histidine kinase n=1 Tax=Hyella patelloides LEGE 07179 TaxID=945734 RepID=A0A563VQB2_9CYAN